MPLATLIAIRDFVKGREALTDQASWGQGYIFVNIPLLVLSLPFWNIPIDHGDASEPALTRAGMHATAFPLEKGNAPESFTSLVWDVGKLSELIVRLDRYFDSLNKALKDHLGNVGYVTS